MRIAFLGAGMMTEALGERWIQAGHEVLVGGRTPEKAAELAGRLGDRARAVTLREAAELGDVVVLSVRYEGLESTLAAAGAGEGTLAGKVVIDVGNAVDTADWSQVTWEGGRSMAEEARRLAPGSTVVKAFNTAYADVWRTPAALRSAAGRFRVPIAGDETAKAVVRELIADLDADVLDVGDLTQARHLEALAILVIRQLFGGAPLGSTFAFVDLDSTAGRAS